MSLAGVGDDPLRMGIANVRGEFGEFEGTLETKESLADCRAIGTVQVAEPA